MVLSGNEVTAANEQRRNEELAHSPVGAVIDSALLLAGPAVAAGSALAASGPPGLAIGGSIVAGLGIVEWFRKLGSSKVNENLEALGQATEDALSRVENYLREHGVAIEEIKRRLDSQELKNAMASASLQALRTTQQDRLRRLALILANGVKFNDLEAENTDDMMRAAVELTEHDVRVLKSIYEMQLYFFTPAELAKQYNYRIDTIRSRWTAWWQNEGSAYRTDGGAAFRSSTVRLQSTGLIVSIGRGSFLDGPSVNDFELLPEGKKFYERVQEIGAAK